MTTQTKPSGRDLLKGKPTSGGGDKTEIPSEDVHDARIVALIDLGTHEEQFQGGPKKWQRKFYLVYELDEAMTGMTGVNHVVGVRYTLSHHEKATFGKLAQAILNDGKAYTEEVDYFLLLGEACSVQISHETKKGGDGTERTYAKVADVTAVSKKHRAKVFAAKRPLSEWYVGDDLEDLPDWLPRIYGEKVSDVISHSKEMTGKAAGDKDDEGEAPGDDDDRSIPF